MSKIKQLHHPEFSLWQSAVDQTVAKHKAGQSRGLDAAARPDIADPMVAATATVAYHLERGESPAGEVDAGSVPPGARGFGDVAKYCSSIWWEIAKARVRGDADAEQAWKARLGPFTTCDARYAEAAEQYVESFKIRKETVPYKVWQKLDDFIIEGKLPAKARVVIFGDWGTGQEPAKALLKSIAATNPDVVIHLGDVYYSGTEFEVENYFLNIWKETLDLSKIQTFSLAGNHDMYSGGKPYYDMIGQLGQPASYFCLRNDDWQFIALDTGLHDDDALDARPTYLEDTEVQWLRHKIDTAGKRRTVLLSHHQLYTAFESIGGNCLNDRLYGQVEFALPKVTAWFWGHEHNQVIYKFFQGVLGRCVGHAAYPVGITEVPDRPKFPQAAVENVRLAKGSSFYSHGYAVMDLDGPRARVSYYQDSDPSDRPMFTETLPTAAAATPGADS